MTINISGLDKGAILAALWNNAALPPAYAYVQTELRMRPMTSQEARPFVAVHSGGFDYFKDRLLKININSDDLDPWGYDRDNGDGLAGRVISNLRATGSVDKLAAA